MDGRMLEGQTMAGRSLTERVDILEKKMESLEVLPAHVASLTKEVASLSTQFLQQRDEIRAEFSAVRTELRGEIRSLGVELRGKMQALGADLRREMRELHEAAMSQTRMLFEELVSRIATMQEGQRPPKRKR